MTYKQALADGKRIGAAHAQGAAQIAQLCQTLVLVHPGTNPELVYNGAMKLGLTARQLATLANEDPVGYGALMFE